MPSSRSAPGSGREAVGDALAAAGLAPEDVDVIVTTSVTGVAAPSLDARLVPLLGLRPDVRRIPVFGLGCVAGAAGVARVDDLLRGDPDAVAVLLSVELCSLTVQRDDSSMANLVGSGLFGDGAAAVVMVGDRRAQRLGLPGPHVVASRSRLYPGTERVMGWDVGASGFRIVLSAGVAELVEEHLGEDMAAFLGDHDLKTGDIVTWVAHPGGPKVLEAMERTLDLAPDALRRTWASLSRVGNLSSSSVLHVLADTLADPSAAGRLAGGPAGHGSGLLLGAGAAAVVTSDSLYVGLVLAVAAVRVVELGVSERNRRWSLAHGGIESGAGHYPVMVVLHTGLLVGAVAEVLLLDRPFLPWLGWPMLAMLVAAHLLRWWCITTLGRQWCTRIIVVPGSPRVTGGPYRWLQHPNYLAVVVEGFALPLVHTAWVTAAVFTVANAVLLRTRIAAEEQALRALSPPRQ